MKKLLLAASMLTALALPAQADVVLGGQNWTFSGADNLTLTAVVPGGNQPQNVQCIICGANQPQQSPTFGYTDFHNAGNQTSEIYFSTNVLGGGNPGSNTVGIGYGGTFLRDFLLANGDGTLNFTIGVDVNDTNNAQTLTSFFLLNLTTHTVLSAFTTPTSVPTQNNGTGFPDYTLSGFNIAVGTDIHVGDQLIFFARLDNANDGPDSFFIQPAPVPGPIAGAGIPGLIAACCGLFGFNRFRRKRLGTA
jgi:hypothetical protein